MLLRIAAPVLALADTGAGEGRAVSGDALTPLGVDALPDEGVDALPNKGADAPPDKGVDAPPDKGVDAPLDKGVDAPPDKGVDTPPDKGVDAPPDKGVDAPPVKGVDTPPDKDFRTSPGKDSAGTIRVARLLLALSSDVTATDDEAMRAFSTGSSSFAIPNVPSATGPPKEMACSARGVNGQGRILHLSVAAVETSSFGGLGRRLRLSARNKWPGVSSPPLRCCWSDWTDWPGPLLLLHSSFGGFSSRLDLSRQE